MCQVYGNPSGENIYLLFKQISMSLHRISFVIYVFFPVVSDLTHAILVDALLLCVFVAQHSLMACSCLKKLFDDLNMAAITRPLYVCSTCCVIQVCVCACMYECLYESEPN